MAISGPIVIVDDDPDDQETIQSALNEAGVKNKCIHFNKCPNAFDYLKTTTERPFIIICDVNLPQQNGIEFKRQIDEDAELRSKSIPFIFLTTAIDKKAIDTAYKELTVQGFFQKAYSYKEMKGLINLVIEYWKACRHPNS